MVVSLVGLTASRALAAKRLPDAVSRQSANHPGEPLPARFASGPKLPDDGSRPTLPFAAVMGLSTTGRSLECRLWDRSGHGSELYAAGNRA